MWTTIDLAPSRGNLSVKSLVEVVKKEDIIQDSEYMETLFVAVPKYETRPPKFRPLSNRPLKAIPSRHGTQSMKD